MSVHYLTAILARLARRRFDPPVRYVAGELRVIACGPRFPELLALAFAPIRRNAVDNVTVLTCLLQALETLAGLTGSPTRRQALLQQAQQLGEVIQRHIPWPVERQALTAQSAHVIQLLNRVSAPYV
jgi:uncharacterized membrane protein